MEKPVNSCSFTFLCRWRRLWARWTFSWSWTCISPTMSSSRFLSFLLGFLFFPLSFFPLLPLSCKSKNAKWTWTQGIMSFGWPPCTWSQRPCRPDAIAVICLSMRDEEKMKEWEGKKDAWGWMPLKVQFFLQAFFPFLARGACVSLFLSYLCDYSF